jgi:hypothetical protein
MFSVLITRNLILEDFGLYSLIGSLIAYAMFGHIIISYWVPRQVARNEEVGKTAIFSSGLFCIIGTIAYLILAIYVSDATDSNFSILLLGALIVPITYFSNTLDNVNHGHRPQALSYSLIAFEIAKVPFGYLLLVGFDLGLSGALIATILALLVKLGCSLFFALPYLHNHIDFRHLFRWLKLSWLPLYGGFASNLYVLDTLIVSAFLHSTTALAYWASATTIAMIASHSVVLSQALVPKLVADARKEHVRTVIRLFSLFGIPLFIAVLVFAKPLLFLLNPAYTVGILIVYILAIRAFSNGIFSIFAGTLSGIERIDTNETSTFSQYRKSNFFLLGTFQYIRVAIYIIPLIVFFILNSSSNSDTIELVIIWATIATISELVVTVFLGIKVHQTGFLSFDWKPIVKYTVVSIIAGIISMNLIDSFLIFERDLMTFLPGLALTLAIGGGIYIISMYFLDEYMRSLIKSLLKKSVS